MYIPLSRQLQNRELAVTAGVCMKATLNVSQAAIGGCLTLPSLLTFTYCSNEWGLGLSTSAWTEVDSCEEV